MQISLNFYLINSLLGLDVSEEFLQPLVCEGRFLPAWNMQVLNFQKFCKMAVKTLVAWNQPQWNIYTT